MFGVENLTWRCPAHYTPSVIGNKKLQNVAPASDTVIIPEVMPKEALDDTITCLKEAVCNSFVSAFLLLASGGMAIHYEKVQLIYGMCVAVGPKNVGKSIAAKCLLTLLGTPQFFVRDFTATQDISPDK